MTVAELIAALAEFPAELVVVHSTGTMQDREEVTGVRRGDINEKAWNLDVEHIVGGAWVEVL